MRQQGFFLPASTKCRRPDLSRHSVKNIIFFSSVCVNIQKKKKEAFAIMSGVHTHRHPIISDATGRKVHRDVVELCVCALHPAGWNIENERIKRGHTSKKKTKRDTTFYSRTSATYSRSFFRVAMFVDTQSKQPPKLSNGSDLEFSKNKTKLGKDCSIIYVIITCRYQKLGSSFSGAAYMQGRNSNKS